LQSAGAETLGSVCALPFPPSPARHTPAQGAGPDALPFFLLRALDEIDYAMVLLDSEQRVWHTNHLARVALTHGRLLHVDKGLLDTRIAPQRTALKLAIERASKGIRSMVTLRPTDSDLQGTSLALVPMGYQAECFPNAIPVMVIACRPVLCEPISLHFFAQSHGLTRTEEAVLLALAQGKEVEEIAAERGLVTATVRGYVKQLRIKTQSASMRELLNKVSVLPPVVSSIKAF
jgi:DNA-binding CsgD family transcriptional regulator